MKEVLLEGSDDVTLGVDHVLDLAVASSAHGTGLLGGLASRLAVVGRLEVHGGFGFDGRSLMLLESLSVIVGGGAGAGVQSKLVNRGLGFMLFRVVMVRVRVVVMVDGRVVDGGVATVELRLSRVIGVVVGQVSGPQDGVLMEVNRLDVVLIVPLVVELGVVADVLGVMVHTVGQQVLLGVVVRAREIMVGCVVLTGVVLVISVCLVVDGSVVLVLVHVVVLLDGIVTVVVIVMVVIVVMVIVMALTEVFLSNVVTVVVVVVNRLLVVDVLDVMRLFMVDVLDVMGLFMVDVLDVLDVVGLLVIDVFDVMRLLVMRLLVVDFTVLVVGLLVVNFTVLVMRLLVVVVMLIDSVPAVLVMLGSVVAVVVGLVVRVVLFMAGPALVHVVVRLVMVSAVRLMLGVVDGLQVVLAGRVRVVAVSRRVQVEMIVAFLSLIAEVLLVVVVEVTVSIVPVVTGIEPTGDLHVRVRRLRDVVLHVVVMLGGNFVLHPQVRRTVEVLLGRDGFQVTGVDLSLFGRGEGRVLGLLLLVVDRLTRDRLLLLVQDRLGGD